VVTGSSFKLGYVPGVTPSKWQRTWAERVPEVPLALVRLEGGEGVELVRDGAVDAALLRLPVDRTGLHAIPLYTETTVVVVPKEHWIAAADEVAPGELAEEVVLHPVDDVLDWARPPGLPADERPVSTAFAFGMVAAEAGLLLVPQSLARLNHRKDLVYRPVTEVAESSVALVWSSAVDTSELMEQFIGIVRGRTVNSTRGRTQPEPKPAAPVKQTRRRTPQRGKPRRR
jgi:DNA-binding transcriptional LysR family regulator